MTDGRINSARDWAYEQLKQRIIDGDLAPGERLTELQLCEVLEVSRTPLRAALQRLQQEGLVERTRAGHLHVAPMTPEQVRQLFAVRAALESLCTYEATLRMTPDVATRLVALLAEIELAAEQGRHRDVSRRGSEFHRVLYEAAGNQVAIDLLTVVRDQIERYRHIGPDSEPGRSEAAAAEHRHLCELVLAGDAEGAAWAAREHVLHSLDAILRVLAAGEERPEGQPRRSGEGRASGKRFSPQQRSPVDGRYPGGQPGSSGGRDGRRPSEDIEAIAKGEAAAAQEAGMSDREGSTPPPQAGMTAREGSMPPPDGA